MAALNPLTTTDPTTINTLAALSGLLSGLNTTQITTTGQATEAGTIAAGAKTEAEPYTAAGSSATENEKLATLSGQLQIVQEQREVARTQGAARAAAGAGGVTGSGSVLDVLQSSYQQGALGEQLLGVQAALVAGGYAEAGAAVQGEVAAAGAQQQAALAEQAAYTSEATNAANQIAQIQKLYAPQLRQLDTLQTNTTNLTTPQLQTVQQRWSQMLSSVENLPAGYTNRFAATQTSGFQS